MQLSARGAQKRRDESKKLQMYSKQWLPGDTLRVFYPLFWTDGKPDIAVGAIWGHSVSDIKKLGLKTAFIPSTTDFDENAMPIGQPDITYQFSQIAKIFVNGAKAKEEANIMQKDWPTESSRKEALKELEDKYDTKNNRKAVRPIIGKVQYYISTEVLSLKMVNGQPNTESLALTSAPLSNQTIRRLYDILDDPKFAPAPEDMFLEVEWKYPAGAEKDESGRNATPVGLTPEYRLSTQFPSAWQSVVGMAPMVAKDAETIVRRATRSVDPLKVRQALTKYAYLESEYLDMADEEDEETLLRHTSLIKELDLIRPLHNEELIDKIKAKIAEMEADRNERAAQVPTPDLTGPAVPPNPATASPEAPGNVASEIESNMNIGQTPIPDIPINSAAPSIGDLIKGQQDIAGLMNNPNNMNASDADMAGIDIGATMV